MGPRINKPSYFLENWTLPYSSLSTPNRLYGHISSILNSVLSNRMWGLIQVDFPPLVQTPMLPFPAALEVSPTLENNFFQGVWWGLKKLSKTPQMAYPSLVHSKHSDSCKEGFFLMGGCQAEVLCMRWTALPVKWFLQILPSCKSTLCSIPCCAQGPLHTLDLLS